VGTALATATPHSQAASSAWSFSASPTETTLWCERPISLSAAASPEALLIPEGSTITEPLLKITCSSRPSWRMASSTSPSWGVEVATMAFPTDRGMPDRSSRRTNSAGGGSQSTFSSRVAGRNSSAPFSATTASNSPRRGKTISRSGSWRPVTSSSRLPELRTRSRAARVASST
jgi:hypothetical protein